MKADDLPYGSEVHVLVGGVSTIAKVQGIETDDQGNVDKVYLKTIGGSSIVRGPEDILSE